MSHMNLGDIFHDRRTADRQPQPESGPVQDPEVVNCTSADPRMSEAEIIDSLRFPSASPGQGTIIVPRKRDRDLCRHCDMPMVTHQAASHLPEPMAHGKRTPGVHSDVEDGRTASTQREGIRPTPRRDLDLD